MVLKNSKLLARYCFHISCMFIFTDATSPVVFILCVFVIQIWCHAQTKKVPRWLPLIFILLANDIELNPGPPSQNHFLNFMNWNLNSLVKGEFERVSLIEAHNTIFDYDLISVCKTNLNDSIEIPDPLLKDFTFISANHPSGNSRGGVGLFYKSCLPVIHRRDLAFDESIVIELKFGRKKNIFHCAIVLLQNMVQQNLHFSYLSSKICIQKSWLKIHMLLFSQVISLDILSSGGQMGIQTVRDGKLKSYSRL